MGGLKQDKVKKEVYKNPKPLEDLARDLFSNTGLKPQAFKGWVIENDAELAEWETKGGDITARYPKDKQHKIDRKRSEQLILIPTPPKLGISQAKNIDSLGYMLQRENWKRDKAGEPKTAEFEFAFKDYARIRGYSDGQIARGGEFLTELKRDLFSGAYTTYRGKVKVDGKLYTAHGLPNIYILLEPDNKRDKWKVVYNEPYRSYYLNSGQYYPVLLTAIQDKNTDNKKGYLYFFFKLVMSYASTGDFKTQLKVSTLLDKIKAGDRTQGRPQEAFNVLAECIYYTATKYGVIKEVRFFDSGKCEKVEAITDLDRFNGWDYNDFAREVLTPLGLSDIREALISFNTPPKELLGATGEADQTGQDRTTL